MLSLPNAVVAPDDLITLGRMVGCHGVQGWLKVYSYTQPKQNILNYPQWYLKHQQKWYVCQWQQGKLQGKNLIVLLPFCHDRNQASELLQADIAISRQQLPELNHDEYYWSDLLGLTVVNPQGACLGQVDYLMDTGANDVLVVKGEKQHLVPFVLHTFVLKVDLENRQIVVNWDKDF